MRNKRYVSVPLKKEMVDKVCELDPNKPLKALVSEAIAEYIANKTVRLTNKTSDISPILNYQYNNTNLAHRIT